MYTISDNTVFGREEYTKLRANRSPREADLVKRLNLLDRRVRLRISVYSVMAESSFTDLQVDFRPFCQPRSPVRASGPRRLHRAHTLWIDLEIRIRRPRSVSRASILGNSWVHPSKDVRSR